MIFNLTDIGFALIGMSLKHFRMVYEVEHCYTEYILGTAHEPCTNNKHLTKKTLAIQYVLHNLFSVQWMQLIVK